MTDRLVLNILGEERINGERFWRTSWRPARDRKWLRLGDRFDALRRIVQTLELPAKTWTERVENEWSIDLVLEKYERQSSPGGASVQFSGSGAELIRPPSHLADWHAFHQLLSQNS